MFLSIRDKVNDILMGILSKQVGWSQESNLLWELLKKLDRLIGVTSNVTGLPGPPGPAGPAGGVYAQTSLGTLITNTTVETSLIGAGVGSLTVPANGFNVGDSFTAKICGSLSCANNETIHVRIKSNGVTIADTGIFQMKLATNKYFELLIDFTITKIGGAGVAELFVNGQYSYNQNANTNLDGVNFALISNTNFNTTIINTLSITAEWGLANVVNKIQSQNFVLTKVY